MPSPSTSSNHPQRMPAKQKMAFTIKSLVSSVLGGSRGPQPPAVSELFAKTDPAVDGDDCLHDCDSCSVRYPRGFKIDTDDVLYGQIKAWSTHLLVGTGKADWVRDVADEKGSVMEAVDKAGAPANGNMKLSASNMPTPHDTNDYSEPTTVLLLPAFTLIHNVHPLNVPQLVSDVISHAPTSTSPMTPFSIPASLPSPNPEKVPALTTADCPHRVVILMCSQRTRDARCGQSAPLLRKELERHLRPLGLYRDLHDERPGGVGIYFISHVGGHKYSANVMVYRRPNAFGLDDEASEAKEQTNGNTNGTNGTNGANGANGASGANGINGADKETNGANGEEKEKVKDAEGFVGASQCIWLARVLPEDCENLVKYTVMRGKVVKPESQLRGGFDRGRGIFKPYCRPPSLSTPTPIRPETPTPHPKLRRLNCQSELILAPDPCQHLHQPNPSVAIPRGPTPNESPRRSLKPCARRSHRPPWNEPQKKLTPGHAHIARKPPGPDGSATTAKTTDAATWEKIGVARGRLGRSGPCGGAPQTGNPVCVVDGGGDAGAWKSCARYNKAAHAESFSSEPVELQELNLRYPFIMKTTSVLAFILAAMAPLTASLPTSNTAVTGHLVQVRHAIMAPRFLNVTQPEDIPDDPTLPVPGKPVLVPADGSTLLVGRSTGPYGQAFKPRRHVNKRQEKDGFANAVGNIVPLSRPGATKISPFNGTAI
ncbi:hypothetical protein G7Z17_g3346 [Cylindrodendrum hubeiense]|uniref:Uncharacterized protein n=1 Tax=Cylindrodendrum hubeiense TaxID=595255 RepID=A0A9P5LAV2_9HYPO|nr:hypothetical protein G7Z17_g3346 [Cylindrodendrum hubeiense]